MMPQEYFETINELERFMHTFLIIMLVIVAVFILIALAQYIMQSIALTHIGRRRGIKRPWLIWIPIVRNWAIGALADDYDARNGLKRRFRVLLLVFVILFYCIYVVLYGSLFAAIPTLEAMEDNPQLIVSGVIGLFMGIYSGAIVIAISGLVITALNYICVYKIYESLSSRRCVLHFILSIIVPLYMPISLLCLKNSGYPYDELSALPEDCEKGWYEA